jgi:hypothetical protein
MKQGENNQIDSLLRALARRERAAAIAQTFATSAGGDAAPEASMHMDADELSAYAENALPDATRTRYTAHLAYCDDCRKIVTQLAAAAGTPERARADERETAASTWREKLAALLSPRVWRYAMPVLVLFAIAGIGFFVLQPNRKASEIAQIQAGEDTRGAATKAADKQAEAGPSRGVAKTVGNPAPEAGKTPSKPTATKAGADDNRATSTEAPETPPAPEQAKKDSATETAAAQPTAAAAPPPKPTDKVENVAKPAKSEEARDEDASESKKKEVAAKNGAVSTSGLLASRKAAAQPQGRRAREGTADEKASGAGAAGDRPDNETETRAVAGHRFRRQNGAWVDVAFDSSRSITNVARGSEQYRALIADEPGIGTIAEQLSGQLIIVWNGRAYRIH